MDCIDEAVEILMNNTNIETMLKEFFDSPRKAIMFGNGMQARITDELCGMFGKKLSFVIVSNEVKATESFQGIPLYGISSFSKDIIKDDYDVIIAVNEKSNAEILALLEQNGFTNCYYSQDWKVQNELLRNSYYEGYFKHHNVVQRFNELGERYIEHFFGDDCVWKLYYPENEPLVISNTSGQFQDIALPSIFGDYTNVTEGPYEYGKVTLSENDIVFDLGSHVG